MGQSCMLTGMVLSSMPVGEYDRRIVILTKERGRITGFVRGARRPKSSMVAATNPFCFGQFEAYAGRDAYTIVRATISNYFYEISMDLEKTCYGCYFLELADYFSVENVDCKDQLKLLYQTMRAMNVASLKLPLIRRIYELKTLVYHGVYPNVFSCMRCGAKENLTLYQQRSRGTLCASCGHGEDGILLTPGALYTVQYIITAPIEKLYTFTVSEKVQNILEQIVEHAMKLATDRRFKSLEFINEL